MMKLETSTLRTAVDAFTTVPGACEVCKAEGMREGGSVMASRGEQSAVVMQWC